MQHNFSQFKTELKKVEEFLSKEYSQLNIGRASPMILDGVTVEAYGSYGPLKNVASISIEDPKTLLVSPWDKSQIKAIEKAIVVADLGLSVATGDSGIRVIFPQLTGETRQKLVKVLKEKLEEARISVRKVRQDEMDTIQNMQKEGAMTEDELKRGKDEIQKHVDETNKNLEALFTKKEQEVMN
jgi:ribosome recycling factor